MEPVDDNVKTIEKVPSPSKKKKSLKEHEKMEEVINYDKRYKSKIYPLTLKERKPKELEKLLVFYQGLHHIDKDELGKREMVDAIKSLTFSEKDAAKHEAFIKRLKPNQLDLLKEYQTDGFRINQLIISGTYPEDTVKIQPWSKFLTTAANYPRYKSEKHFLHDISENILPALRDMTADYADILEKDLKIIKAVEEFIYSTSPSSKDFYVFKGLRNQGYGWSSPPMYTNIFHFDGSLTTETVKPFISIKEAEPGENIIIKTFSSTSADPKISALIFMSFNCCILRIRIPKGTNCLIFPAKLPSSSFPFEHEVLLPPCILKIHNIMKINPGGTKEGTSIALYDCSLIDYIDIKLPSKPKPLNKKKH